MKPLIQRKHDENMYSFSVSSKSINAIVSVSTRPSVVKCAEHLLTNYIINEKGKNYLVVSYNTHHCDLWKAP